MLYKKISLTNLEIIQETILNTIVSPILSAMGDNFYPLHHVELSDILSIPDLNQNLINLGLINYVVRARIGIIPDPAKLVVHNIYAADFEHKNITYSLNIPIQGYSNSLIKFYDCGDQNPPAFPYFNMDRTEILGQGAEFDKNNCRVIDEFTTDAPSITSICVPNEQINLANNDKIDLFIRLKNNFDLDKFCQTYNL
jgi:hypothetical protein